MAEIKPFKAVRYSKDVITNFICPPYDVISPQEKKALKLSPYNIVNIELSDPKEKRINIRMPQIFLNCGLKTEFLSR